jgi:hypothetical protein
MPCPPTGEQAMTAPKNKHVTGPPARRVPVIHTTALADHAARAQRWRDAVDPSELQAIEPPRGFRCD